MKHHVEEIDLKATAFHDEGGILPNDIEKISKKYDINEMLALSDTAFHDNDRSLQYLLIEAYIKQRPKAPWGYIKKMDAMSAWKSDLDDIKKVYETSLTNIDGDKQFHALNKYAHILYNNHDYESVVTLLQDNNSLFDQEILLDIYIESLMKLNRYETIVSEIKEALSMSTQRVALRLKLAFCLLQLKQDVKSMQVLLNLAEEVDFYKIKEMHNDTFLVRSALYNGSFESYQNDARVNKLLTYLLQHKSSIHYLYSQMYSNSEAILKFANLVEKNVQFIVKNSVTNKQMLLSTMLFRYKSAIFRKVYLDLFRKHFVSYELDEYNKLMHAMQFVFDKTLILETIVALMQQKDIVAILDIYKLELFFSVNEELRTEKMVEEMYTLVKKAGLEEPLEPSYKIVLQRLHILFSKHLSYYQDDLLKYCFDLTQESYTCDKNDPDKLNIAICISGQLRGYKQAFELLKHQLDKNEQIVYDVFIHTWEKVGAKIPVGSGVHSERFFSGAFLSEWKKMIDIHKLSYEQIVNRYPRLLGHFKNNDNKVNVDELLGFYAARDVVVDDETDQRFSDFTNQDKMLYKIQACNEMSKKSDRQYDLVIRLRPDKMLKGFDKLDFQAIYRSCCENDVIYTDGGLNFLNWSNTPIIADQLAIATPNIMDYYANTFERHDKLVEQHAYGLPKNRFGHKSIMYSLWANGAIIENLYEFIENLGLSENMTITSEQVLAYLEVDAAGRNDLQDQKLIEAIKLDIEERRD